MQIHCHYVELMLFIPVIHQPVVTPKTVGINHRTGIGFALNNGHQLAYRAVFDYLGVHSVASLEHPENRDFARRSAPSFPSNPVWPEVALIEFYLAVFKRSFGLTNFGNAFAKSVVKFVDSLARNARQLRRLFSLNVKAKKTNYLSCFALRNVRNFYIPVFHCPTTTYKDYASLKLS